METLFHSRKDLLVPGSVKKLTSSGLVKFPQILEVCLWVAQLFSLYPRLWWEYRFFLFLWFIHLFILFVNIYWVSTDCQAWCYLLGQGPSLHLWLLKTSSKHSRYGLFLKRSPDKSLNIREAFLLLWALLASYLWVLSCFYRVQWSESFILPCLVGQVTS